MADCARSRLALDGNHAGIIELSEAEFGELPARRPAILDHLRADGIDLAGTPVRAALTARTG